MDKLAFAYWKLCNWVKNTEAEKKMAAESALRQIGKYLKDNNIEIFDFCGQKFDRGLAVDVIDKTADDSIPEEELYIAETIKPIILKDGEIICFGQVILGEKNKISKVSENKNTVNANLLNNLIKDIDKYNNAENADKFIKIIFILVKKIFNKKLKKMKEGVLNEKIL